MTIQYTPLSKADYEARRYNIIKYVEESGKVSLKMYDDSAGLATIGVGMLLEGVSDMRETVITHFTNGRAIYADPKITNRTPENKFYDEISSITIDKSLSAATMQAQLNAKMLEYGTAHPDWGLRSTFTFRDEAEVREVFTKGAAAYEAGLSKALPQLGAFTEERLAAFSIYYNSPSLLGPKFKAAIAEGNRAEAWYEIRYQSNGDNLDGLAKRRYYESELFKLYKDKANPTKEEAEDAIQMYGQHRQTILNYDKKYDSNIAAANSDYKNVFMVIRYLIEMIPFIMIIFSVAHSWQPSRLSRCL